MPGVRQREGEQRPPRPQAVRERAAGEAAEPEAGHERRDDRGRGQQVDAGVKRQHALPDDLERQRGEAGGREDGEQ